MGKRRNFSVFQRGSRVLSGFASKVRRLSCFEVILMPSFLCRSDDRVPGDGAEAVPGDGFLVLDGGALGLGAAVASVDLREIIRDDLSLFGWALLWCTFGWVALTATGPFLLLVRRCFRPVTGYPRVG